MKQKAIFIFFMLIVPVLSQAQLTTDFSINSGINGLYVKNHVGSGTEKYGFMFKGGIDLNYHFNSKWGLGTGLFYSYYESFRELGPPLRLDRSSRAIGIPVNVQFDINPSPIHLLFGVNLSLNLNKQIPITPSTQEEYLNTYLSLQLGCIYQFNSHIKLGLFAEPGITPYFRSTILNAQHGTPVDKYFLRSLNLKLSYTLFGK